MSRLLTQGLATATAASMVVLLGATAATADTARHGDRRHDVASEQGAAPRAADPDITRVTVRHGAHRLVIRVTARNVSRDTDMGLSKVATPRGRFNLFSVLDEPVTVIQPAGPPREVRCPGLRTRRNVARDTVVVSVPRRCLGNPRWVRAGAVLYTPHPDVDHMRVDDGFSDRTRLTHLSTSRRLYAA